MSDNSGIEWTDATWNPVAGCSPVSPGCTNCYAATMARRLEAMGQDKYINTAVRRGSVDVFTGIIGLDEKALGIPLKWRKPKRIFVNSMSDLFHEAVPTEFIRRVWRVMMTAKQHTYQVLTKRPERMIEFLQNDVDVPAMTGATYGEDFLPRNIWLGVSVEDQKRKSRIDQLRQCPAAVRFLSVEPLLEDVGELDLTGIHWVIVGGESGRGARPCNLDWITSIIEQCKAASVACFVKQLGAVPFTPHPGIEWKEYSFVYDDHLELKSRKGGDPSEWPEDLRVREFPTVSQPA